MKQSTFLSSPPPSPADLSRRAETYRPMPNSLGRVDHVVLELMDGTLTLGEVVDRISETFPNVFGSRSEALGHVADLSTQYALDRDRG